MKFRAKEGDFASLVVRKRGPPNMAALIRKAQTIEQFLYLMKEHLYVFANHHLQKTKL